MIDGHSMTRFIWSIRHSFSIVIELIVIMRRWLHASARGQQLGVRLNSSLGCRSMSPAKWALNVILVCSAVSGSHPGSFSDRPPCATDGTDPLGASR